MYDTERDACGIGFVAHPGRDPSRAIIDSALDALCRVRHRGAVADDALSGDGSGILFPLPAPFLETLADEMSQPGAEAAFLGLAMVFSRSRDHRECIEQACRHEGIDVIGWRTVPVEPSALGGRARSTMPVIEQALLLRPVGVDTAEAERRCIRARKRAEATCRENGLDVYFASISFRTVTYKGLCVPDQLASFYLDLQRSDLQATFAIFHQRFSTNTDPSWERAQPFRTLCHNGEINTIQGNINRMKAREGRLGKANLLEEELLRPVIDTSGSDSAMLDNVLELMVTEGRDLEHAAAMLVPAAWESLDITDELRDFYRYHACLIEPWDGPAGLIFTDGIKVGASLDRNGLRPLRYQVCEDGFIACASEVGAVDVSGRGKVQRRKLGPGRMILVGSDGLDEDPVSQIARSQPYGTWCDTYLKPAPLGEPDPEVPDDLLARQAAAGYTREEFTTVIRPMATTGHEPTSSMGDDTAPAVLAQRPRPLYNYFKQRFAQVTNPPIDHVRERSVMSLRTLLGPRDPLMWERPEAASLLELESFILFKVFGGYRIDAVFPISEGARGLRQAVERIATEAEQAARLGSGLIVISDREIGPEMAAVPMLLAVGAVHQRLLSAGHRTRTSIIVETDEAREVHHFACLLGYGAEAICPRLVLESIAELVSNGRLGEPISTAEAVMRYRSAVEEGVLKVLSKMGISTTDGYRGAQIFDAIGIDREIIDLCFTGTPSPVGGIGFTEIAEDVLVRHLAAFNVKPKLENPGYFKHHAKGEYHANNPEVVEALHAAVENGDKGSYARFAALVDERPVTEPRDLLTFRPVGAPLPIDDVEPASEIARRFSSGAISHGAIGAEAHETLARAMNMIGGKANSGEGGEDPSRFADDRNCRIKQVASGRFGVTPQYLAWADELQIKMAQGSKPGEGGQLPGHKVTDEIARLRHTQPGVALISPPPHHDIYSIEDLAQLIFDLKQANPTAEVSVKLVSEAGVGTIAAGVAKALADVVQVSGWDGGTGASPLSSIKNAGLPWELGLAEAHQSLLENGLRDRVKVRVDGGMKSGRDVVMAALLGADEFSFGTSVLLAEGCIMVRACHRDTCPVGIATQRPELRAKFTGTPEKVARYLMFVAEEVRELLAQLGLRSVQEAVGRSDLLASRDDLSGRALLIDLSHLLHSSGRGGFQRRHAIQDPRSSLGDRVFDDFAGPLIDGKTLECDYRISNADRTVGARLGAHIARRFPDGPPPGRGVARFEGQAGQSFGAFLSSGITFELLGEANDYVSKGMGGGRVVIRPPDDDAGDPYLVGNTVLYGATGGELFVAGRAGERFGVRNSGAVAVVEGVGDHCCEYMTGGTVVVLGDVGHNFGAGMTGGQAYVWDPESKLKGRVNTELVEANRVEPEHLPEMLELIAAHAEATGSTRALDLLEDLDGAAARFYRIAPKSEVARIEGSHEGSSAPTR